VRIDGSARTTRRPADWWDPAGRFLIDRRTSLIADPADGRLPPTTPEAQAKAAWNTQQRRQRGEPTV
jgi:hypothetical protein